MYELTTTEWYADRAPNLSIAAHGFHNVPWIDQSTWTELCWCDNDIDDLTEERANELCWSLLIDSRQRYLLCAQGSGWPNRRGVSEELWCHARDYLINGAVIPIDPRVIPQPELISGINLALTGFSANLRTAFYGWPDRCWPSL